MPQTVEIMMWFDKDIAKIKRVQVLPHSVISQSTT